MFSGFLSKFRWQPVHSISFSNRYGIISVRESVNEWKYCDETDESRSREEDVRARECPGEACPVVREGERARCSV